MFIVIEGTDGSGKTTQTELLINKLRSENYPVETISFPQYGERSAAMVEDYLNGHFGTADEVGPFAGSILYATDRFAAKKKISAWLRAGKIVVANRYIGSNMGHQGGKITDPNERKKFFDWNYNLEYTIFGIPKPDINLILHMPATIAQALVDKKGEREYLKGKKRDIHEDDIRHLSNAETAYLDMAEQFTDFTLLECAPDEQILTPQEIHDKIWSIVGPLCHQN
jgi:dTMP kinase